MTRFNAWNVIKNGFTGQKNWDRQWRDPEPKKKYDIKWIVNSEINDYIREYHKEKIAIIRKAFQILRNKDKYFSEILNCVSII